MTHPERDWYPGEQCKCNGDWHSPGADGCRFERPDTTRPDAACADCGHAAHAGDFCRVIMREVPMRPDRGAMKVFCGCQNYVAPEPAAAQDTEAADPLWHLRPLLDLIPPGRDREQAVIAYWSRQARTVDVGAITARAEYGREIWKAEAESRGRALQQAEADLERCRDWHTHAVRGREQAEAEAARLREAVLALADEWEEAEPLIEEAKAEWSHRWQRFKWLVTGLVCTPERWLTKRPTFDPYSIGWGEGHLAAANRIRQLADARAALASQPGQRKQEGE